MAEYIPRVACVWKAHLEELYTLEDATILFIHKWYFLHCLKALSKKTSSKESH